MDINLIIMKKQFCLIVVFLLFWLTSSLSAQNPVFTQLTNIPVTDIYGQPLPHAWSGGLNAPQFSKAALNNDTLADLVIFDRSADKFKTYLNNGSGGWQYAPAYERMFPQNLNSWVLLRDYNCDGLQDIFAHAPTGIQLFKNVQPTAGLPAFQQISSELQTIVFGSPSNLSVSSGDIPAIADVDNDGDLDILTFSLLGSYLNFHENTGTACNGGINYTRKTGCWGNFREGSNCITYDLNINCPGIPPPVEPNPKPVNPLPDGTGMHAGSTVLTFNFNSDQDQDLILGDLGCNNMVALTNGGSPSLAQISSVSINYPPADAVNISFPAAFYEDVTGSAAADLLVSTNESTNSTTDYRNSSILYQNTGTTSQPTFNLLTKGFLQKTALDWGETSNPAVADLDSDGDLDIVFGYRGLIRNGTRAASLVFLKNTGTTSQPAFEIADTNYASLLTQEFLDIKPSFTDYNNDGQIDLVFTANKGVTNYLKVVTNTAAAGQAAVFNFSTAQDISLSPGVGYYDKATFADVNNDGKTDLLLAKINGKLHYYKNTGTAASPVFTSENTKYGNIENTNFFSDLLHVAVADVNADGKPDLVAGNGNGELLFYDDLRSGASGAALTSINNIIYNPAWNLTTTHRLGNYINPAAGDFNGDGKADLVVGVQGGGLLYFENGVVVTSLAKQPNTPPDFTCTPNPATDFIHIYSPEKAEWQLINLSGQVIQSWQSIAADQTIDYPVGELTLGLYIIQLRTRSGSWSQKLVVR